MIFREDSSRRPSLRESEADEAIQPTPLASCVADVRDRNDGNETAYLSSCFRVLASSRETWSVHAKTQRRQVILAAVKSAPGRASPSLRRAERLSNPVSKTAIWIASRVAAPFATVGARSR